MPPTLNAAIRVVIADNHPLVIQALTRLFRSQGDVEVVASCRDGNETLLAVRQHAPDVVVLDPRLPGADGLEVIRQVRAMNEAIRVVVLTAVLSDDELVEMKGLGVSGLVLKGMAPELLIPCIRKAHAGEQWLEDGSVANALAKARRREADAKWPTASLTGREVEVVRLAATGVRNKEVARRLHISECTVKAHLSNVYEKLGLGSRLQLSLYARSEGIL